jgi:hypothetical protein
MEVIDEDDVQRWATTIVLGATNIDARVVIADTFADPL